MNNAVLVIFLFVIAGSHAIAQDDEKYSGEYVPQENFLVVYERGFKDIDSLTLELKGIWIDEGTVKADIVMINNYDTEPEPLSYLIGDLLVFDTDKGRKGYYITEIFKLGEDEIGYVVLNEYNVEPFTLDYPDKLNLYEGIEESINDLLQMKILNIQHRDRAFLFVKYEPFDSLVYIDNYEFGLWDTVWLGRSAYYVGMVEGYGDAESFIELTKVNGTPPPVSRTDTAASNTNISPDLKGYNIGDQLIRYMHYFKSKKDKPGEEKYCLVEIASEYTENGTPMAMPFIEIERNGEKYFVPFVFVEVFDSKEEAVEYARENNITDVELE